MKIVFFLSTAIFLLLAAYYSYLNAHTDRYKESGHVFLPNLLGVIGLICMLLFLIPLGIIAFTGGSVATFIALCCFVCFSASLPIARINCRVEYDAEGFTLTTFIGACKRYSYKDLTGQWQAHGKTVLYAKDRPVRIDDLAIGEAEFVSFAKKRWRAMNGGIALPKKEKYSEKALFRKNVKEAGVFIIIYSLILVFGLVAMIAMLTIGLKPTREDDLTYIDVTVESIEIIKNEIHLTVEETDFYFELCGEKKLLKDDPVLINRLSQRSETYKFGYKMIDPDGKHFGYIESIISYDGSPILSLETANQYSRENTLLYSRENTLLCAVLLAVPLAGVLFCLIMTILIGRHPERYSKRVKKLLFKDGYIG
ncbi:MAG: hypothetical protein IJK02_07275 [Clostridia bacterium]|nr:hypothetical protein [Clostridia bacterium]